MTPRPRTSVLSLALVLALALFSWPSVGPVFGQTPASVNVVTTVAPLANIALNVGGTRVNLKQIIPDGTDSHTFEPAPSDALALSNADLIVVNGLHLEGTTLKMAEANKKPTGRILLLGDNTITRDQWLFDFSFPEAGGDPNPHLWMNPAYAMHYAELIRDQLVEIDPANAAYYQDNTDRFLAKGAQLDQAILTSIQTVPEKNRKLLTYHDSFAYFAPRYGMTVIGAIQPSDFAEPTPREVAALIEQLKTEQVPAIFGSEVFPSKVLDQIGKEAGVTFVSTLRDDDLPGAPDAPEHSYIGMLQEDVVTMTEALGGDASAVKAIDPTNTFAP
ncbi:MAG: zinc ABC transporter substrate-binding protein [Chloroflexi bacterium]|nr:zinc ABC transporter substrate-binding protein [Chloroflexota bacterium]